MTAPKPAFSDGRSIIDAALPYRIRGFAAFGDGAPQAIAADGTKTWIARGANFVVAASFIDGQAELSQHGVPDESMLIVPPDFSVSIATEAEAETIADEALLIIPPGSARIIARGQGPLIRIFSSAATDMGRLASNAADYSGDIVGIARREYWPTPIGGFSLRTYRLREHSEDVGFGRLFRSTNLMVNIFEPAGAARNPSLLSPHDHADFEQGSLTLTGDFTHYLRTPWTRDSLVWRADEKLECSGCSLVVIPPRVIHTTSWSTAGARLVDIFGPPREDFSLKPRWVRNADDYPLPDRLRGA